MSLISRQAALQSHTLDLHTAMSGLSPHTRRAYKRWIRRYAGEVSAVTLSDLSAVPIAAVLPSLTTANLKTWLGKLKDSGLGRQSLMQAKAAIIWLAQLIADIGYLSHANAAALSRVKVPRAETARRNGTWLSADEIRLMLQRLRRAEIRETVRARNLTITLFMAACGLRRDEVASAMWQDIARQGGYAVLKVHGKGGKTRIVKLPNMVLHQLAEWRKYHPRPSGDARLFTRILCNGWITDLPITDRAVWLIVKQSAELAGLPHISPHDLRRSFARGAYEAGVPFELIRQALGHSSLATTERYVNSALELRRAATDIWAAQLG